MKKLAVIAFVCTVLSSFQVLAQKGPGGGGDRVKAVKIGMITESLQLSESQAEKFWPVYNAYSEERMSLHREIRKRMKNAGENQAGNDEEVLKRQDEVLALKEKEIELVKQYRGTFLKVITPKQYADLLSTEERFNQMLMQRLKERDKN